mgnify:FL=1
MNNLTKWISALKTAPKKVFVVHGDESAAVSFAGHIKEELGYDAYAPYSGDAYDLITGQCIQEGSRELVEKKTKTGSFKAASTVFDRLIIAGERLMSVIKKCQGMANKDLAKFADQINALCDKWDR